MARLEAGSCPPRSLRRADPRRLGPDRPFRNPRLLPGRALPGCGFAAVSGVRGPLLAAFSPTHFQCVAAWSGLARFLKPCRIEVLKACRIEGLQD